MNGVEASLRDALTDLQRLGARCALVGGLAISVRVEPRLTRDVDMVVDVRSDAEAEALVADLLRPVEFIVEHEVSGRLAAARLTQPDSDFVVDLLFASSGIESEIVDAAEMMRVFDDLDVPVASTAHLMALKILARADDRPQDQIDLVGLRSVANAGDFDDARAAVRLITVRGYARGRDLEAGLDELIAHGR